MGQYQRFLLIADPTPHQYPAQALQCDAPLHLLYAYDLSPAFNSDAPLAGGGLRRISPSFGD
jgi:hypothetical protein